MAKNLFNKVVKLETPYAVYKGYGPFGWTETHVLRAYQAAEHEAKNQYARWFVAVKSDCTHGGWDMGDSYIADVLYGGPALFFCTKDWADTYPSHVTSLTVIFDKEAV